MKASISGIQTFTFGQDLVFDAYIQYKEYIGFVKAMNSLKGMKLLYKDRYEERSWAANIKVWKTRGHLPSSRIDLIFDRSTLTRRSTFRRPRSSSEPGPGRSLWPRRGRRTRRRGGGSSWKSSSDLKTREELK